MPSHWASIRIVGALAYRRQLLRGAQAALAPTEALDRIADDVLRVVGINFTSQGRRGGGSWKDITEKWEQRKLREGKDSRILIATGTLMRSVSVRGAPFQDLDISGNEISLDTTLSYADMQAAERPYYSVIPSDRDRWAGMIRDGIMEAMYGRV